MKESGDVMYAKMHVMKEVLSIITHALIPTVEREKPDDDEEI